MGSRNTVTLTFAGDSVGVEKAVATTTASLKATAAEAERAGSAMETAAREAGSAMDGLAADAERAGRGVDQLGDEARETTAELGHLERRTAEVKAAMAAMAREFDATGDEKTLRGLRSARAELGRLEQAAKALGDGGEGGGLGARLREQLAELPGELGGAIPGLSAVGAEIGGTIAIAAAAAIAPIIPVALGGAGVGAAAAAGIAAGIAAAATDSRVAAAAQTVGNRLKSEIGIAAREFADPLIWALQRIEEGASRLGLAEAIAPLAAVIKPVTEDLMVMAERAMPGIRSLFAASAPMIEKVADQLPGLGESIGSFAESIAAAGPEGAKFFSQLIWLAGGALEVLGKVIEYGSKIAGFMGAADDLIALAMGSDKAKKSLKDFGSDGANSLDDLAKAAGKATANLQTLTEKANAMSGTYASSIQAEIDYSDAVDRATESLREHGATLDQGTDAGKRNMETLLGIRTATLTAADATLNETTATRGLAAGQEAATAAFARGRDQIYALALKMGYGTQQAQELANRLLSMPEPKNIKFNVDVQEALSRLQDVRTAIGMITASWGTFGGGGASMVYGSFGAFNAPRARGGPVEAGETYLVGEERPELFVPSVDGVILPEVPAMGGPARRGSGDAGRTEVVVRYVGDSAALAFIKRLVSIEGGGDVQQAFGW